MATSAAIVADAASGPPPGTIGFFGWLRRNLFSNWWNTILTVVVLYVLYLIVPGILNWLILDAVWSAGPPEECRKAGVGACWSVIHEKHRVIIFGRYTYEEQWRPLFGICLLMTMVLVSCFRRFWRKELFVLWLAGLAVFFALMWGGFAGMAFVPTTLWGGLPLTMLLSICGIIVSFPLAILLALGRRSQMPLIRWFCVGFIEFIRGVPLISLLFMASFLLPLFLPRGVEINALLRAQVAIIMFASAYLAEVIRGGLQAIPKGQYEAADALGLSYWQKMLKIVLPQAIVLAIPPIVNTFIGLFKDTSLVGIVGLTDLLRASQDLAIADINWRFAYAEVYTFIALIYFVFCFFMSKYSQYLERQFETGRQKRH